MVITNDEFRRIAAYCAEEVRRQGEVQMKYVATMIDAWLFAIEEQYHGIPLSVEIIQQIGLRVKPDLNNAGFRTVPIFISDGWGAVEKAKVPEIAPRLERWVENLDGMTPLEAYREFEEIHPFRDGNGRTGKIILNWLNGTLLEPIFPPDDFWGKRITNP